MSKPLRRDAQENRARILAAATEVFAERGLGVSLDDVARQAGVGVGTVYRRFPDKAALVEALFEQRLRDLVDLADHAATLDPWEAVVAFLTGAAERMAGDRGLRDAALCFEPGQTRMTLARAELGPRLVALTERAQQAGRLRPDVTFTDLVVVLKSVHVLDVEGLWRRQLTILLDGLSARHAMALPGTALSEEELQTALDVRLVSRVGSSHQ